MTTTSITAAGAAAAANEATGKSAAKSKIKPKKTATAKVTSAPTPGIRATRSAERLAALAKSVHGTVVDGEVQAGQFHLAFVGPDLVYIASKSVFNAPRGASGAISEVAKKADGWAVVRVSLKEVPAIVAQKYKLPAPEVTAGGKTPAPKKEMRLRRRRPTGKK